MILVTGATGHIGRHLVAELETRGADYRIFTRNPQRANTLPGHAPRVTGDLDKPALFPAALAGVDRLFLLVPGIGIEHTRNMVEAAQAAAVNHIVLVSSYNVMGDPMPAMGRWHHERETLVKASGIDYTFLRPGGFMTNALEWAPVIRVGGEVVNPTGPGRFAPIDPADIAAVAAVALTGTDHRRAEYYLTGAQTYTVTEQVAVIAEVLGRDIPVREAATAEEAVRSRYPNGAPPALAEALLEGLRLMRSDTTGFRTSTVADILHRQPRTFTEWCQRNEAAFRLD